MKSWRRYEILLPLRFNTGKAVSKVLLAETLQLDIWLTSHEIDVL